MKYIKYIKAIILVILLTGIDQLTKYLIVSNLELHESIPVIKDVFEIYYIQNRGAAWGIMQGQIIFFVVMTVVFTGLACYFYQKMINTDYFKPVRIIILFCLSGAFGNCIDRIVNNYVVDFLYIKAINFPVFNVADVFVTIPIFILLLLIIFKYKESDFDIFFTKKKDKAHENSNI